jgi:serine/threonine protein phosphatase 1
MRPPVPTPNGSRFQRRRVVLPAEPAILYAVGDVHGCLDDLLHLEEMIAHDGSGFPGPRVIVMLGDYVDRGPDSAGVVQHLTQAPPQGFYRLCLAGNHDTELLRLLDGEIDPNAWLRFAGPQTLLSYGCDLDEYASGLRLNVPRLRSELQKRVPLPHRQFLRRLALSLTTPRCFFAHAGARSGVELADQAEDDLLWLRWRPEEPHDFDRIVVHGHTIVGAPVFANGVASIDTGAFAGGGLTAARIGRGTVRFLSTRVRATEPRRPQTI